MLICGVIFKFVVLRLWLKKIKECDAL